MPSAGNARQTGHAHTRQSLGRHSWNGRAGQSRAHVRSSRLEHWAGGAAGALGREAPQPRPVAVCGHAVIKRHGRAWLPRWRGSGRATVRVSPAQEPRSRCCFISIRSPWIPQTPTLQQVRALPWAWVPSAALRPLRPQGPPCPRSGPAPTICCHPASAQATVSSRSSLVPCCPSGQLPLPLLQPGAVPALPRPLGLLGTLAASPRGPPLSVDRPLPSLPFPLSGPLSSQPGSGEALLVPPGSPPEAAGLLTMTRLDPQPLVAQPPLGGQSP